MVLPEPVAPTTASVDPAGTSSETSVSVGAPGSYAKETSENRTSPRTSGSATGDGLSTMSTGRSRYSKMRANSASELCTCTPVRSSAFSGLNREFCRVVNATSVPIETVEPPASARPPSQ